MTTHPRLWRRPARALCAFLTLFIAVLMAPVVPRAASISIPASKDNTLFLTVDGSLSSGAGEYFFAGSNSSLNVRRGVIAFDIAAHVPAGATIDSVTLALNVSSAPNDTPQNVALHRILAAWGEGTSVSSGGAGAASTAGDATWLHRFYPDTLWSSAGGDFDAAVSAAQIVGVSGPHTWSGVAMTADVQSWLDQPASNHGWLLQGDEATASSVRRFDSRENATPANRPYLVVHYTYSATTNRSSSWGAVKWIYHTPTSK